MKIGVIGAGMIGGTVGKLWHTAGHEIRFGTRHPEALEPLVAALGKRAWAGAPAEAVVGADAVLLAVPLFAMPDVAREIAGAVTGKTLLDASNAYASRDRDLAATATKHAAGSSGWVASNFPGAQVVKAFNTVYFKVLAAESRRGAADGIGIPLAGDDEGALATARRLVEDAGFTPVVVGPLAEGRLFEPGTPVYNTGMHAAEVARELGLPR